jgi:hypothetical protein
MELTKGTAIILIAKFHDCETNKFYEIGDIGICEETGVIYHKIKMRDNNIIPLANDEFEILTPKEIKELIMSKEKAIEDAEIVMQKIKKVILLQRINDFICLFIGMVFGLIVYQLFFR